LTKTALGAARAGIKIKNSAEFNKPRCVCVCPRAADNLISAPPLGSAAGKLRLFISAARMQIEPFAETG